MLLFINVLIITINFEIIFNYFNKQKRIAKNYNKICQPSIRHFSLKLFSSLVDSNNFNENKTDQQ